MFPDIPLHMMFIAICPEIRLAQYGISLDSLAAPDNAQTKVAQDTSDLPPATPEAAPPIVEVDTQPQKPAPAPKKRKPRAVPSVMELLDEYEDPEVLREAKAKQPKARQYAAFLQLPTLP